MLSVKDDEFSYDSRVSAFKSVAGKGRKLRSSAITAAVMSPTRSNKKMYSGNVSICMLYICDPWKDAFGTGRVSVQWLVTSGKDTWKKVDARVATSQRELFVSFPMPDCLSRSDFPFVPVTLEQKDLAAEMGSKKAVKSVLKQHTKTVAQMSSVSKVKGRNAMHAHNYIQHIALPPKVKFQWAKKNDGDEIFHGKQLPSCQDACQHSEQLLSQGVSS
eukprot:13349437-Ditylum_brightwellii.AAC.1